MSVVLDISHVSLSLSLQEVRSSLKESQRTASELGEKLQEVQLARSSAEQVPPAVSVCVDGNGIFC